MRGADIIKWFYECVFKQRRRTCWILTVWHLPYWSSCWSPISQRLYDGWSTTSCRHSADCSSAKTRTAGTSPAGVALLATRTNAGFQNRFWVNCLRNGCLSRRFHPPDCSQWGRNGSNGSRLSGSASSKLLASDLDLGDSTSSDLGFVCNSDSLSDNCGSLLNGLNLHITASFELTAERRWWLKQIMTITVTR